MVILFAYKGKVAPAFMFIIIAWIIFWIIGGPIDFNFLFVNQTENIITPNISNVTLPQVNYSIPNYIGNITPVNTRWEDI